MVVDKTGQETKASRNCDSKYLKTEIEQVQTNEIKSSLNLFKVSAVDNTVRLVRDQSRD